MLACAESAVTKHFTFNLNDLKRNQFLQLDSILSMYKAYIIIEKCIWKEIIIEMCI